MCITDSCPRVSLFFTGRPNDVFVSRTAFFASLLFEHLPFICFFSNSVTRLNPSLQEMLEIEPGATWARLRLGLHHLRLSRPRHAIAELQAALRMQPKNAEAWESLGAAYEQVGRLQAALKVYERAVELDDSRVFALTQVRNYSYFVTIY
jgi:Tfp pilus assembly protein PilF